MEKWKVSLMVDFNELEEMELPLMTKVLNSDICFEDECCAEEDLYEIRLESFKSRSISTRNDDFYKSQKRENLELEKLLDEIYERKKR